MIVGVISDTHGLMRPQALDALAGSELILHAGDIGSPGVLEALRQIGPLIAVRGNNDKGAWAQELADSQIVEAGGVFFYVLHDVAQLDLDPRAAGFGAVVSGHSHRPKVEERNGVLYLNPGSAGPRRFKLPITVARVGIGLGGCRPPSFSWQRRATELAVAPEPAHSMLFDFGQARCTGPMNLHVRRQQPVRRAVVPRRRT